MNSHTGLEQHESEKMMTGFGRTVPLTSEDHLSSAVHGPEYNCWSDLMDLVSRYKQNNPHSKATEE